ncbi:TPA: heme lyase NrfEFG subunit NrfF [Pasteurella multocida]|uniref:heme lyase NrfEFG subunit NrfF n=1 Tax=Pasteurella multocida TaxID=747 RepID=UPI0002828E85|nr:heme lyase NrfEFG subunit NrfF [Pasteurella multocida]ARB74290.1 heme lyase NrfEFG subunit NrfF [Pasteurella multocida]EJZ80170.1 Cytochrome c-type heme lyase subunit nrfF, nitrite reductase complex assembly [Pasteurella multocida subsp. gallicida X73]MCL7789949.1 heme lyase NrfEFG subunit NrfF [Pasteurella multocida]NMK16341.1 heme lyase NrfEFG subunit NrfF [Pasteurella multocida]OBP29298.1 cytochrome c biogenesis protein CcmH [Pasteurella multocida subsp. multocida]
MPKCGKFLLSFVFVISVFARADMVDTYSFNSPEERVRAVALAKALRCPQCQNQNLVESNSPIAYDLRIEVYSMVNEGKSNQQIIDAMTARFGNFVLYKPPFQWTTLLLWLSPIFLTVLAFGLMWRYAKKREKPQHTTALEPAQQAKLTQLLKQTEHTGNKK